MIVEGQLHGGIVHGIGQALCENCIYDSASGQLLSGSFMYYCMPRADNMPRMTVSTHSTPSVHTPMGVKGCGEVGTIGSPAAVTNAVVDALSHGDLGLVTPRTTSAHLITFARGHMGRVRGGGLVAPIKAKDASSGRQERV
jgi:xanthine dehydrogenase molybdopterin-binding subunit B